METRFGQGARVMPATAAGHQNVSRFVIGVLEEIDQAGRRDAFIPWVVLIVVASLPKGRRDLRFFAAHVGVIFFWIFAHRILDAFNSFHAAMARPEAMVCDTMGL